MYHRIIAKSIRQYNVNFIIKILILSDFLIWSSNQLLAPIFAIFVVEKIGDSIEVVGIAAAIYLITKSIFEIPVGAYIDKAKDERYDLYTAFIGTVLTAVVYFLYIYIDSVFHIYVLQALMGVGAALAFPGWYSIFTKHVDNGKEAFEWSLYDVLLGMGMAFTAALGGFLVQKFGFDTLFVLIGLFTLAGAFCLLLLKGDVIKKSNKKHKR